MADTPEFSFRTRRKNLDALRNNEVDLLVIGGGITGAGIVRDAALRGLRVALVERCDFATGTSSRSSKLIHGGLRYLQQGDVGLVIEAANERRVLRRIAPHVARRIRVLVPVHGRSGYAKIRAGLWTFDRMARVEKDERNTMLGRGETLKIEPLLRAERVYGAGVYYECLTDDARLVIENIKSAAALGAVIANYTEVTGFLSEAGRLTAAMVRDTVSGDAFPLHARAIVNAAGPWMDGVRMLQGEGEKPRLHLTKGIHLVLRRERLPVSGTVIMNAADRRSVFAVPRGDVVYLGTTDTDYDGPLDNPVITADDANYLLDAANATFAVEPLTLGDVTGAWAGLRPLLHQEDKKPTEISRKDEVMVGSTGLISIAGGKLTTYRKMAQRAVKTVLAQLAERGVDAGDRVKGRSGNATLSGGDTGEDVDAFLQELKGQWPSVAADVVERLVGVYGSNGARIAEAIATDPRMAERCVADRTVTRAEVAYAVHQEMAITLEDFLERRARLFLWDPNNGRTAAAAAARWMGDMLNWTEDEAEAEVAAYARHVAEVKAFSEQQGAAPPRAANA